VFVIVLRVSNVFAASWSLLFGGWCFRIVSRSSSILFNFHLRGKGKTLRKQKDKNQTMLKREKHVFAFVFVCFSLPVVLIYQYPVETCKSILIRVVPTTSRMFNHLQVVKWNMFHGFGPQDQCSKHPHNCNQ